MRARVPRVSVGLPVFNGEKYLSQAVESVLGQEFEDFELVISDNASTDETGRICQEYARQDRRIRYSRNEANIGLAPNHNRVFTLSRGEFFKWAAHDDEYPRQMLRRYVEAFDSGSPSASVVYSVCEYIDEFGNSLGTFSDRVDSAERNPHRRLGRLLQRVDVYNCTYGLIRSALLRQTRLHGSFPIADRVLFSELAMLGEFLEIQEPLLRLRIHKGRSFTQYTNPQALRELFDPVNRGKRSFLSIEARVQMELLRSAWRVPPRLPDKMKCFCTALVAPNWRKFRGVVGRKRRRLMRMVERKTVPVTETHVD
jgi:glycosyltransferase involved in cell wall biosynthesis